jgi:hypothetical protein
VKIQDLCGIPSDDLNTEAQRHREKEGKAEMRKNEGCKAPEGIFSCTFSVPRCLNLRGVEEK